MFEEVLKQKKHFILIGGDEANIIIGTDALSEVAEQSWFKQLMAKEMSVKINTEDDLAKAAAEAEEQLRVQEERLRVKEREHNEVIRAAAMQRQQEMQTQQSARQPRPREIRTVGVQAPQVQPQQQRPQTMEFPFMDVPKEEMTGDIWTKMTPEQQSNWRQKNNV